jgi:alpha-1,2-mannosyltransferase
MMSCSRCFHSQIQRVLPWGLLVALLVASFVWIRRPDDYGKRPGLGGGDFGSYLLVGNLALEGRHIYDDAGERVNTWPPLFSVVCIPLALLARPTPYLARIAWLILNYLLLWRVFKIFARLIHQKELRWRVEGAEISLFSPELLLPAAICARFILSNFEHLQAQIVLFALVVLALDWHVRGWDLAAGFSLGFAAALKVMPAVFIPYFFYRRQWRLALIASVAAVAFFLSPIIVYGEPRFLDYMHAWHDALHTGWRVGKMNQSVFAMIERSVVYGIVPWHVRATDPLSALDSGAVLLADFGLIGAIAIWGALVFRGAHAPDSWPVLVEYGVVFIASSIFGPVAWKSYLVVLLFPVTVVVGLIKRRLLPEGERRLAIVVLASFFALAAMPSQSLFGKRIAETIDMLSGPLFGSLGLLVYLLWLRMLLALPTEGHNGYPKQP